MQQLDQMRLTSAVVLVGGYDVEVDGLEEDGTAILVADVAG